MGMPSETGENQKDPKDQDKRSDRKPRPDRNISDKSAKKDAAANGSNTTQKLKTIKRALHLVWQGAPGWTSASIALIPLQAALTTLPIYLSKLVVDAVATGLRADHQTEAARQASFRAVGFYILVQAVVMLLSAIVSAVAGIVRNAQAAHVTDYVTEIVHAKSIEVDLEYYENARYYDTLRRAQNQASYRPVSIVTNLLSAAQNTFSLLALVGLLFSLHWGIALLLFLSTIPGAIVRIRYSGRLYGWQRKRTPTERLSNYFDSLLTGGSSAKEMRLFNLGALFLERAKKLRVAIRGERLQLQARNTLLDFAAQVLATVSMYGAYAFAAYRTLQGSITLGGLTMYFGAFQRGQGLLQQMLSSLADLYESSLFLSDLDEFLDLKRKVEEPTQPLPVPSKMQQGVRFENVGFDYPNSDRHVLKDVSLSLRPGEMIALVGENGSGKTTITKLLCRLYDPTHGRITLDGLDLRAFTTTDLRSKISVIFQDYEKYQLSARENIWLGNIALPLEQEAIREQIEEAARYAGADAVIGQLKEGYETTLGKMFEGGAELSIGQWQKVALARAFLRDAQIIVLDEPTSAMDAKAEYEFFRDFRQLAQGRATVLVSHRFSTVRMADCIYVLENGEIVESGTHEALVAADGKYAHLFEMQAQHYR